MIEIVQYVLLFIALLLALIRFGVTNMEELEPAYEPIVDWAIAELSAAAIIVGVPLLIVLLLIFGVWWNIE